LPRANWKRRFPEPLYPRDYEPLETLADAKAYLLKLPDSVAQRNEWQNAARKLMEAAEGKVLVASARSVVHNALVVSLRLAFAQTRRD
jgi:hypothetical protein